MGTYPEQLLSLCTGGGGLDRGVHMALGDARTVCYVEYEASAVELLVTRMEEGRLDDAPVWTDIHTFRGGDWRGRISGVIAGIPCQPHSVAGKGLGADDPRDLWPVTAGLLRDVQPRWFLLENVPGILPYYFERIRPELSAMGYCVKEVLITAAEVGAPHKRERLFVLANTDGARGRDVEPERNRRAGAESRSYSTGVGEGQGLFSVFPPGYCRRGDGDRKDRPCWRDGCPTCDAWRAVLSARPDLAPALSQSEIRSMADGLGAGMDLPRAAQLRLTGNGVVPQQAAYAVRLLQLAHTRCPSEMPGRAE